MQIFSSGLLSTDTATFYFIRPMTRAEREQQKTERLLFHDNQGQRLKILMDTYWDEKQKKKEELKTEEEECYEKWAAEHGPSIPDSSPDQSIWEKRYPR